MSEMSESFDACPQFGLELELPGEGKGTVEFVALHRTWNGLVHGGFQTRHRFVDLSAPEPRVALNETWQVTLYNVGRAAARYWMFDLASTQQCATASPLKQLASDIRRPGSLIQSSLLARFINRNQFVINKSLSDQ